MSKSLNLYRIAFPLYHHLRDWAFVIVQRTTANYPTLRWYRKPDGLEGDARFINDTTKDSITGAYNAYNARPDYYDKGHYLFLEVASNEQGPPLDWQRTSDTAACMLALAQSMHGAAPNIEDDTKPIVLISCSAGPLPPGRGYEHAKLRIVSEEFNEEENVKALKNKWRAAIGGREERFPILALVVHDDDAKLFERTLGFKAKELTEDIFHKLATSGAERPALISVTSEQLPLLARALAIEEYDFTPKSIALDASYSNLTPQPVPTLLFGIMPKLDKFILYAFLIFIMTKYFLTTPKEERISTNYLPIESREDLAKHVDAYSEIGSDANKHASPNQESFANPRKPIGNSVAVTHPNLVSILVISPADSFVTLANTTHQSVYSSDDFEVSDASRASFKFNLKPGNYPILCSQPHQPHTPLGEASVEIIKGKKTYVARCPP